MKFENWYFEKVGLPTIVIAAAKYCISAKFHYEIANELFDKFKEEDGIDWLVDWIGPDGTKEDKLNEIKDRYFTDDFACEKEWADVPAGELLMNMQRLYPVTYDLFKDWAVRNFVDDISDSGLVRISLFEQEDKGWLKSKKS